MVSQYRRHIEYLNFGFVIVNAILSGCSFTIATNWSHVVETLVDYMYDDMRGREVLRQTGTVLMTTCLLCSFSAATLYVGRAWTRAKQSAIDRIIEELETLRVARTEGHATSVEDLVIVPASEACVQPSLS